MRLYLKKKIGFEMKSLSHAMNALSAAALLASTCVAPSSTAVAQSAPQAATLSGCGIPAAQVKAALEAQGQFKMIVGNRMALTFDAAGKAIDSPRVANVFTSNADGSLGYRLEGNQPLGTPSTSFCVGARYTNIRFNDWNRAGVPEFARIAAPDPLTLQARCNDPAYTNGLACGSAQRVLETADRTDGLRVMMSAQAVNENGQGGRRIFVLGSPTEQNGHIEIVDGAGVGLGLAGMDRVNFTPEGEVMIKPVRTASAGSATTTLAMASPR
ncbi:MAG: hypothetical protein E6R02_09590 [Gammaproteobacteria bacterium]|nr:MAG: hypothetical protein E6R02_09590 [Gammaproteobacteria bacterium]